jgi:formamidopyrimidine-DNA glycosylase
MQKPIPTEKHSCKIIGMPELPEVETVRRGIAPALVGRRLLGASVRQPSLRWPVPADLHDRLNGRRISAVERRGKYLLIRLDRGALILHLGMSGSLRLVHPDCRVEKHDHVDIFPEGERILRFRDPRRFGAILLTDDPERHSLIAGLGIEPLSAEFDGDWLYALTRGRSGPIKPLLMNASLLVGVGNIYANESLFRAGIRPETPAGQLSRPRCAQLAASIRSTLEQAILAGGSSLRDFVDGHGKPGYFQQSYAVYGREGAPCLVCGATIQSIRQGNRATFFCRTCQKRR